jgi:hypothetical protein
LAASLALGAPGSAFAQSAGDDQYRDPFGEDNGQQQEEPPADPGGTTDDTGTPAPVPAPAPAPAPQPAAPAPTATTAATLPRTGLSAGVVAALGTVLIAAGLGLRRAAGPARD